MHLRPWADVGPIVPGFNYEAYNASVCKFNTIILIHLRTYNALTHQISTQSGNAHLSYWWFSKVLRFGNRWTLIIIFLLNCTAHAAISELSVKILPLYSVTQISYMVPMAFTPRSRVLLSLYRSTICHISIFCLYLTLYTCTCVTCSALLFSPGLKSVNLTVRDL